MHVTGYETYAVPPRWLFLKLSTSDGTVGWGEPIIEGRTRTVRAAVGELVEDYLIGEDPSEIERLWQRMYRGGHIRGGPVLMSALAGVDQTLWDIKGKQLGAPVHDLLGGRARDEIRVYTWINGRTPDKLAADARRARDAGYTAVKMPISATNVSGNRDLVGVGRERLAAVREAIGDDLDVAVDCRGRVGRGTIRTLETALAPHDPLFLEEPVLPEHNEALADLATTFDTAVATGQRMFSRWEFKHVLGNGVDYVQPDVSHVGGITELRKIATMAAAHDVDVLPKNAVGPIALAACLQLDACTQNFLLQEQSLEVHRGADSDSLVHLANPDPFDYDAGYLAVPTDPGLGVTVDEQTVRERAVETIDWQSILWHNEDGSVAEW
jgi:galactonate dehydratase